MKHNTTASVSRLLLGCGVLMMAAATACSDDVNLGNVGTDGIATPDGEVVYVVDAKGKRDFSTVEMRDKAQGQLTVRSNSPLSGATTVTLSYDPAVLEAYNARTNNSYQALPSSAFALADGGVATVASGSQAATVSYTITSPGNLDPTVSYAVPLKATASGTAALGQSDDAFIIFVRDLSSLPDAAKWVDGKPGVKVFSCMEVNDTNPLNNLSFTLASNGKPLVDALIMFSGNINYDASTGRTYLFSNENVQALLDNREKYLKPLKDRGIKIIYSILGNHDRAGVSNLSPETAKAVALEAKALCDAYDLDGIMLDDEYTSFITPPPAGFIEPSSAGAARFYYELKQAMPDRINFVYAYSTLYSLPTIEVDGRQVKPGEYIDYAVRDYMISSFDPSTMEGVPVSGLGYYSQEFAQGRTASEEQLRSMRDAGYGANLVFAMDPNRKNFDQVQLPAMQRMARALYDDELVFDGVKYKKDW